MVKSFSLLLVGLMTITGCSSAEISSPSPDSASTRSATADSPTASKMAADSCTDGGHGISAAFTNSSGLSGMTIQTQADSTWSKPTLLGSDQSWTGTSPYNCDTSTYGSISLTVQYEVPTWHNNWVSVELKNHVGHGPNLKVCSLLGQGTEVWCDSFEGMLPGETQTMKPRNTNQGTIVGVVTIVRKPDDNANSQYAITATCPASGCTWPKPN